MEIIELLSKKNKEEYIKQIKQCDWKVTPFLCDLIEQNKFEEMCGKNPRLFLLVDDGKIESFCTYVHQDEINDPDIFPWIGFVYTFPKCRGKHNFGKLLEHILVLAKDENHQRIYVSTNEVGLYEKYGFIYYKNMLDITGNDSRIYYINV